MYWLWGNLVCFDPRLPRPGWRGQDLGLPTVQGILTALWTEEGRGGGRGKGKELRGEEEEKIYSNDNKIKKYLLTKNPVQCVEYL